MKRIWFNRWFSVAYHYMNMIRRNPDGKLFYLCGTHPDPNHMSLQACDYTEQEPILEGYEYVKYCLNFCIRNHIDVFIPRLNMFEIAQHAVDFDKIGTKLMVCRDISLMHRMMYKHKLYEFLEGTGIVEIPDFHVVRTVSEFKTAYQDLTQLSHKVCFKPVHAEGGMGFRLIKNDINPLQELYGWVSQNITFDQVYNILTSVPQFEELMVMEMLEGYEYSIDCLADGNGKLLVSIPRRKSAGRLYHMEEKTELMEIAERISLKLQIPYAYNIQVKYNNGVPKLLEINPRMSGGLYFTGLTGVNIPYLAVCAALDMPVQVQQPKFGITSSYIEQPIRIGEKEYSL